MKDSLLNYGFEEVKSLLIGRNEKPFRATQIFKALHSGLEFSEMTELSKPLRESLSEEFFAQTVKIIKTLKSIDGTEKFLFLLNDGNVI